MPTVIVEIAKIATPLAFTGELPRVVFPFEKVTVPVGVPVAVEVTVAETVMGCSKVEGLVEEVSAILVLAFCTTCLRTDEVLGSEFESPL